MTIFFLFENLSLLKIKLYFEVLNDIYCKSGAHTS